MINYRLGAFAYNFAKMTVKFKQFNKHNKLEVRDGQLGFVDFNGTWYPELDSTQKVFEEWLDQQIYGG